MKKDKDNITEIKIQDQKIIDNVELNIWEALIPVVALIIMLFFWKRKKNWCGWHRSLAEVPNRTRVSQRLKKTLRSEG